jgi:hypothetical protein
MQNQKNVSYIGHVETGAQQNFSRKFQEKFFNVPRFRVKTVKQDMQAYKQKDSSTMANLWLIIMMQW